MRPLTTLRSSLCIQVHALCYANRKFSMKGCESNSQICYRIGFMTFANFPRKAF